MRTSIPNVMMALGWILVWAAVSAIPSMAQVRVDDLTEVRSIRFAGLQSLSERRLRQVLKTRDRGSWYRLHAAVGKLPFVPGPSHHPVSPLELQRDVVRLRRAATAAGFPRTQVRYRVARDEAKNLLDITFVIEEGHPVIVTGVSITGPDSLTSPVVPEAERDSWRKLERSLDPMRGERLDVKQAREQVGRITRWWSDRGYPRAGVFLGFKADTALTEVALSYRVLPGSPARFGRIDIEGNRTITENVVRQQLGIRSGAPYSARELEQARLGLQELDIVRVAFIDVPGVTPSDSTAQTATASLDSRALAPATSDSSSASVVDTIVPVRVRITEAERRFVSGEIGYVTDAGLSSEARWTHRNFSGGGRTLTIAGLAQTGWLAIADNPDIRYRASVSLKQPHVFERRTSGVLSPFVERRDDIHDRSLQYGVNATLVHRLAPLQSVSLDYQISRRRVYEYRLTDLVSGDIGLLSFLTAVAQGQLDSLGTTLRQSVFTLSGSVGSLDDPANPRRGGFVRPAIQVTAPTALSTTAYWRLDAVAHGFVPLSRRVVLAGRLRLGRLFPFGVSLPGPGDDPRVKFLQLRDATFTAGGTGDVRGWENGLLGPKVPEIRFSESGDTTVVAGGFVPLGGIARASFSLELQVLVPALGPNFGTHLFLDGGRVWTDDTRFDPSSDRYGQERTFYATGAGVDLRTPVGPIKFSVGYKLNPSITDLVDSADLLTGVRQGQDLNQLPKHNSRRWQLHLAIGASY